jgi:hypothetical protein
MKTLEFPSLFIEISKTSWHVLLFLGFLGCIGLILYSTLAGGWTVTGGACSKTRRKSASVYNSHLGKGSRRSNSQHKTGTSFGIIFKTNSWFSAYLRLSFLTTLLYVGCLHGAQWSDGKCWQAPISVIYGRTNTHYSQSTLWQVRQDYLSTVLKILELSLETWQSYISNYCEVDGDCACYHAGKW